jgi:hypothetical protein
VFVDNDLKSHLESSSVVRGQALVTVEWNLNLASNISKIGNYRYRPYENVALPFNQRSVYATLNNAFDESDTGRFYTNATDADVVVDGGYDSSDQLITFTSNKQKEKLLYSLESCFEKFRPRSGINKLRYFDKNYSHHSNSDMSQRPRYYMAHKDDPFKYWSSYRTESGFERGIANRNYSGFNYADDIAPFVVYSSAIPANRLVVKMQTNVGTKDFGSFQNSFGSFSDPLFGDANKTVPQRWRIQYLKNNSWLDAAVFTENSIRDDGTPIVKEDGYVELAYGLIIPTEYQSLFFLYDTVSTSAALPVAAIDGQAYLVKGSDNDRGTIYVWSVDSFKQFPAQYGWFLSNEELTSATPYVTDMVSPDSFYDQASGTDLYRELEYISGIRVVVDTMNKSDSVLDLIEMSPRLVADVTNKTSGYSITKSMSDLGVSGLPVGQLLAGTGSLQLFDFDLAFSPVNVNSIISTFLDQTFQVKLYEVILEVPQYDGLGNVTNKYNYYVPIKTMYSDGMPELDSNSRDLSISLRDKFFYFEFLTAPQIFIQDVSLSYAISTLLDYVGFSNYSFKRLEDEADPIIPFFFIPPDTSVAQVLNELAVSTQSAMYFDEYNNFVVASRSYSLPLSEDRQVDSTLVGTKDFARLSVEQENSNGSGQLANIIDIASQERRVFNDGSIQYTQRYIKKQEASISQMSLLDNGRSWVYKPELLWEISPDLKTKPINNIEESAGDYALTAIPINSDLPDLAPAVSGNRMIRNTIDFGEAVHWLGRYSGYFFANGEIIKYDAVEYTIPGFVAEDGTSNFWVSSIREYQKYFSMIPFNGKIFPTGLVRIYAEPDYQTVGNITQMKNGNVSRHGRAQFGTPIVYHRAGIDPYWLDSSSVRAFKMQSNILFGSDVYTGAFDNTIAGQAPDVATRLSRSGIIKNFLSSTYDSESVTNGMRNTKTGTVQSSALVMQGGSFFSTENPVEYVSYVYREMSNSFKHFGTRMRVVGRIENDDNKSQTPAGSMPYFIGLGQTTDKSLVIGGGSGGIGIFVNTEKNTGYFFELAALTSTNLEDLTDRVADLMFYKVKAFENKAIPVELWSGLAGNVVDDGNFTGQYRMTAEELPTVHDLAIEYEDIGSTRRFYLYVNGSLVQVVDDPDPLPIYNNVALFVRGTSRCMFENLYAITANYSQNTATEINLPSNSVFVNSKINVNDAMKKYALSGIVESSYLSGISPSQPPAYNMYFEEFGTIFREAAYIKARYDQYPALYSVISPTINDLKRYTVSGFMGGAYGAEFLVFNSTDTVINLSEESGNYLRIQGATITQESENELTVDNYFSKTSSFSDPDLSSGNSVVFSPQKQQKLFYDIKNSRITSGRNSFSLSAPYLQTEDEATSLMGWLVSRVMKPRLSVGVRIFPNPMIQLGDIITIDYKDSENVDQLIDAGTKFTVYSIEQSRDQSGPEMTIYLSEVGD